MLSFDTVNRAIDTFFSDARRPKTEMKEEPENPRHDVDQATKPVDAAA